MAVKALPGSPFEVVEPKFLFQLLTGLLSNPSCLDSPLVRSARSHDVRLDHPPIIRKCSILSRRNEHHTSVFVDPSGMYHRQSPRSASTRGAATEPIGTEPAHQPGGHADQSYNDQEGDKKRAAGGNSKPSRIVNISIPSPRAAATSISETGPS
jgi:hypothetical protein